MAESPVIAPFLLAGGRVGAAEFEALCAAGSVLERKQATGEIKVVRFSESIPALIIKVWHPKKLVSSARLNPYDRRFRRHARRLRALGFTAPLVCGWGSIGFTGSLVRSRFVCYEALPGVSLRELKPDADLPSAARFIARLHDRGVDFRSLHMGNLLQTEDRRHGLIDLTDCRFLRGPLPTELRIRRIAYFCTHKRDAAFMLQSERWLEFVEAYCQAAESDAVTAPRLRAGLASFKAMQPAGGAGQNP